MSDGTEFSVAQTQQAYPPGMDWHFWNRARNALVLNALRKFFPASRHAVEVGCGPGILSRYLNEHSVSCHGCDLADDPEIPGSDVSMLFYNTTSAELPPDVRQGAQVVLLPDVLEHIEDAESFLREQFAVFPNARNFLVTLPARTELWSNFDEHYGHYRRYSAEQAAGLAEDAGAVVLHCGYSFHALYPMMRLMTLLRIERKVELRPPAGWTKGLHHAMLGWFWLESCLMPKTIPGTSVLLVFTRQGNKE